MTSLDIGYKRLINQQIAGGRFTEPGRLIEWMGCIRAEDTASAKWSIGHRVVGSTDGSIDRAFNEGQILRTRVLQPVWHFVSPADIRWMLALTAPKLKAFNKDIYQALGIDAAVLRKSKRVIVRALEKGQLTRAQLWQTLEKENIHADELRSQEQDERGIDLIAMHRLGLTLEQVAKVHPEDVDGADARVGGDDGGECLEMRVVFVGGEEYEFTNAGGLPGIQ